MLISIPKSITRLSPPKTYPHSEKLFGLGLIFLFIFSWSSFLNSNVLSLSLSRIPAEPIRNSTLGFQEIFALALPDREDRTKPLLDAAKATNLTLTVLNAERDSDIARDAWPKDWNEKDHAKGELGCLISHVRTWNKMIAHNISTALIIESDADWDMRIKEIMPQLAQGIKTLIDWPFNRPHHTQDARIEPYGDTWDIVWIGHCGSRHTGNTRIYSWNDTSVPPEDCEWWFAGSLTKEQHVPGTRTLFQFDATVCSTAYAISLQGATKLARYFKAANKNLDLQLSDFCTGTARGNADMVCLGVWPQIMTNARSESNIEHGKGAKTPSDSGLNPGECSHVHSLFLCTAGCVVRHVMGLVRPHNDLGLPEFEFRKALLMQNVSLSGLAIQFSARMNAKQVLEEGIGRAEWQAEWDTSWAEKNGTWDMVNRKKIIVEED